MENDIIDPKAYKGGLDANIAGRPAGGAQLSSYRGRQNLYYLSTWCRWSRIAISISALAAGMGSSGPLRNA